MSIMPMSTLLSALRGAGRQHITASTVAARQAVTGSHVLRLHGYSKIIRKRVPTGECFESAPFRVGGQRWRIVCYPNGADREHDGYTSLFLKSLSPHDDPFAFDATTARLQASVLDGAGKPWRTQTAEHRSFLGHEAWGWKDFVKNDDLEDLVDDCLTVLCDVTVDDLPLHAEEEGSADPPPPEPTAAAPPSSDMRGPLSADVKWSTQPTAAASPPPESIWSKIISETIWSKKPDVTIHAGGETFPAHRWVLEAVSPVLKADLRNTTTSGELHIDGMDADVFKAMLQFMYKDVLPPGDRKEALVEVEAAMAERLLVAADRYVLEKLKAACGETLCGRVEMGSVAAMIALAERHGCPVLKEACMKLLSLPGNTMSFMETDGYQRLSKEYPCATFNLILKEMSSCMQRTTRILLSRRNDM